MVTILQLEENMFMSACGFAYNVQPMCKNCKMPNAYYYETLVICDLRGWLMVEYGCWGQSSWYSLSFGALTAS